MKKIVWTFGLIGGVIMSVMMAATIPFADSHGSGSLLLGYATIVAGSLLVFFGVRSYRDKVAGGRIGFGRAFLVGTLIAAIASACYTATWEVMYYTYMPDFAEKYSQAQLDKSRAQGKSEAELAKQRAELAKFQENYKNPVYNVAMTFIEPFPVALVIALVSAGVLRRRRRDGSAALAAA